jgi:hypothetical protein
MQQADEAVQQSQTRPFIAGKDDPTGGRSGRSSNKFKIRDAVSLFIRGWARAHYFLP